MEASAVALEGITPRAARCTLIAAILGSSIVFLDSTVVNVALPAMQNDLGGGLAAQQWIVDAYLLTLGSLILVGGSLGDIFGARKIFAIGIAWFGVASVLCAFAPDSTTLIVSRGLQGVGGALLTPASLALLTATFSGAERGAAIGSWTAWSGISFVAGPLLGGWLIEVWSWRAIFLINVPVAIATMLIVVVGLPRGFSGKRGVRLDYLGAVLCAVGLGGLVFGLIEQPSRGWSALVVGSLIGGAACFVGFVVHEGRAAQPMLPLRLFAKRNFSAANLETFVVYGALSSWGFTLSLFLQQIAGWSPLQAGLATIPVTIVMFLLSRYAGKFSARWGPRWFMTAGPLIAGVSILALARLPVDVAYAQDLLPALLGFSVGLSLTVAPLTTTVLSDAGPGDAGIASGVNNAVARIAGLIAVAVIGVVASGGGEGLTVAGFHNAMLVTAALLVAGGVIGAVGVRNRPLP